MKTIKENRQQSFSSGHGNPNFPFDSNINVLVYWKAKRKLTNIDGRWN